jgi:prevent-host-death family protein
VEPASKDVRYGVAVLGLETESAKCYKFGTSKTLTLRDANQSFARCIREVEAGEDFVITRNGTPVARLSPVNKRRVLTPEQQAA